MTIRASELPPLPRSRSPGHDKEGTALRRASVAARKADLLPVGYFHLGFTVPAEIASIAFRNPFRIVSAADLRGVRRLVKDHEVTQEGRLTSPPHSFRLNQGVLNLVVVNRRTCRRRRASGQEEISLNRAGRRAPACGMARHGPFGTAGNGNGRIASRGRQSRSAPRRTGSCRAGAVIPPRPWPGRRTRYRSAPDSGSCSRCNRSSRIEAGGRGRRGSVRRRSANRSGRRRKTPARSASRRCD